MLAHCIPDLSQFDCDKCLKAAIEKLPTCCDGKQGGRVLIPSCNIRYELYPFYHQSEITVPTPEEPRPNPKEKSRNSVAIVIAIVALIVFFSLVTFVACWIIYTRARKNKNIQEPDESVQISTVEYLQFDSDTIVAATNNFSDDNKLGEGGFGEVYKGRLLNGQDIVVKRLSKSSRQGVDEFKNEVLLVAKLLHRNLARLLGFCLDGEEKIFIYEFVPNKSLDYFLFDPEKQLQLNWPKRYKITKELLWGCFIFMKILASNHSL